MTADDVKTITSVVTVVVSFLALGVTLLVFLINRTLLWRNYYWERWVALGKLVLDDPSLMRLWCGETHFKKRFDNSTAISDPLLDRDVVFAEMYIDFLVEVKSLNPLLAKLLGGIPGGIGIANPIIQRAWREFLQPEYTPVHQQIVEAAIKAKE